MVPRKAQNRSHPGFVAVDQPYDCGQCIKWHGEQYGFPHLENEDYEAWNMFLLLQDQQRIGMDIIGLDYSVLPVVWDIMGVPHMKRRFLFEQLVVLNHAFKAHRAAEHETKKLEAQNKNQYRVDR